jgi:ornithine decarboxylase
MEQLLEVSASPAYCTARSVLTFDQARRLTHKYGTPLLVISRSELIEKYQQLRDSLPGVEFFYAAKANPNRFILSALRRAGSSVDVCSAGEARMALRAGFQPDAMIHTHPCKTTDNLVDCYKMGLRLFTFDSMFELPKFVRYAPDAQLLLRLAVTSRTSVINLSAKFGASRYDAVPLLVRAAQQGLAVKGIAFHVGSQCLSPDDYLDALHEAREVWDQAAAAGIQLEILDIGGGIPAPYRSEILSTESFCRALAHALDVTFGDLPVRIIAEPGRCLCAEAVTLVTRVIGKTIRGGRPWYLVDDGLYGSFSGKVYDHADYLLMAENQEYRTTEPCVVAGPTCDSTDVVARDQPMPADLEVGELLLVPTMGAYTSASASDFNGLRLTREVTLD